MLRLRIRDPVPFWPLDPGSGIVFFRISDPGSQTHIFESLITFFWVKSSFLQLLKNKIIFNFVIFVVTKKVGKNIFLTILFVAVFGSGIRDKHPGSATLLAGSGTLFCIILPIYSCPWTGFRAVYPGWECGAAQERLFRRVGGNGRAGRRSRRTQVHHAQPPLTRPFPRQALRMFRK